MSNIDYRNIILNKDYPPKVLYREVETSNLNEMIEKSIDLRKINIICKGDTGEGRKTLFVKYCKKHLLQSNRLFLFHDCKESTFLEIIRCLIHQLKYHCPVSLKNLNVNLENNDFLWMDFYKTLNKINKPLTIFLPNISNRQNLLTKFVNLKLRTNFLFLFSRSLSDKLPLEIQANIDFKLKLHPFTEKEFLEITKMLYKWKFKSEIDPDVNLNIAMLVYDEKKGLPGNSLRIIENLYPILKDEKSHYPNITSSLFLKVFNDKFGLSDIKQEAIYNYIKEANRFERYFLRFLLDDLDESIFVSYSVIQETYDFTCDELKIRPDYDHFFKILKSILDISIIKSKKEWLHHNGRRVNDVNFYKNDEFCIVTDAEMVKQTIRYVTSNPDFN